MSATTTPTTTQSSETESDQLGTYPGMAVPDQFTTEPEPPPNTGPDFTRKNLVTWLLAKEQRRGIIAALVSIVSLSLGFAIPYLTGQAIDRGIKTGQTDTLIRIAILLGVAVIAINTLVAIRQRCFENYRIRIRAWTMRATNRHITTIGAPFERKIGSGELVAVASSDIDRITLLMTAFFSTPAGVIGALIGVATVWSISPWIALVMILGVIATTFATKPIHGAYATADGNQRDQQGRYNNRVHDILAGLRVLTGIGGKHSFHQKLTKESDELTKRGLKAATWQAAFYTTIDHTPQLMIAATTATAAWLTYGGHITVGQLVQAVTTCTAMLAPIMFVTQAMMWIPIGLNSATKIAAVFAVTSDRLDHGTLTPPNAAPLHDRVTGLTIPPGTTLGIAAVNPKDATALLDRIARYGPENPNHLATATWNSHDLRNYPRSTTRQHIAISDPRSAIFAGSLHNMLTCGKPATCDHISHALHTAAATDIVQALPDGLNTHLPAGATNVSGGQRQRLRLARALLANPATLLLNEPTSSLDATTEATIAKRITSHRQGQTTVIATTSPLVLAECDLVAYLPQNNQPAVTATHTTLLTTTAYRQLVLRNNQDEPKGNQP